MQLVSKLSHYADIDRGNSPSKKHTATIGIVVANVPETVSCHHYSDETLSQLTSQVGRFLVILGLNIGDHCWYISNQAPILIT